MAWWRGRASRVGRSRQVFFIHFDKRVDGFLVTKQITIDFKTGSASVIDLKDITLDAFSRDVVMLDQDEPFQKHLHHGLVKERVGEAFFFHLIGQVHDAVCIVGELCAASSRFDLDQDDAVPIVATCGQNVDRCGEADLLVKDHVFGSHELQLKRFHHVRKSKDRLLVDACFVFPFKGGLFHFDEVLDLVMDSCSSFHRFFPNVEDGHSEHASRFGFWGFQFRLSEAKPIKVSSPSLSYCGFSKGGGLRENKVGPERLAEYSFGQSLDVFEAIAALSLIFKEGMSPLCVEPHSFGARVLDQGLDDALCFLLLLVDFLKSKRQARQVHLFGAGFFVGIIHEGL